MKLRGECEVYNGTDDHDDDDDADVGQWMMKMEKKNDVTAQMK